MGDERVACEQSAHAYRDDHHHGCDGSPIDSTTSSQARGSSGPTMAGCRWMMATSVHLLQQAIND